MTATLTLDRFQLMWLCEGAIGKSHLRWDIYSMMVNDVYPQLTDDEREAIFTYIKRDDSWLFNDNQEHDETPRQYFLQMLARFNPANQYIVTLKDGRKKVVAYNAYLWNGKYYVGWQRYCAPENIVNVEKKPYKKCSNELCESSQNCVRYEKSFIGCDVVNGTQWKCKHCDLIITCKGMIDPIAKMIITPNQNDGTKQE